MYQLYDKNRDRPGTGTKHVKTASFFIKTGFSFVKNGLQSRLRPGSKSHGDPGVGEVQTRVWERCRPGSVQGLSVDAWMFIRHAVGVFMPRFCILSGKLGRFNTKTFSFYR